MIKMVKQRSNNDCGVACMAMIAGCTYEEAYESLDEKLDCAHTYSMEKFLNKRNLSIYYDNQDHEKDAIAYLLNCRSPAGSHWVVMAVDGKIYDPSPTPLKEYQEVNFYRIKPKCS